MQNPLKYIFPVVFILALTGCAPKITYQPVSPIDLQEKSTFAVASVEYTPHHLYGSENDVDFDIAERFKTAMTDALSARGLLSAKPDYRLDIVITGYKPGSAGMNILIGGHMPELYATVSIYDNSGELIGKMHSANNRGRGGFRGWNRIFGIVAGEFVTSLSDSTVRKENTKNE